MTKEISILFLVTYKYIQRRDISFDKMWIVPPDATSHNYACLPAELLATNIAAVMWYVHA